MKLYKFHGAGNDFLIVDQRENKVELTQQQIVHLCDRHTGFGSDGLMTVENSNKGAFKMSFYNPDGTSGMMCGNGGRCISAFAAQTSKSNETHFVFEAPDGLHESWIEAGPDGDEMGCTSRIVRLKMSNVAELKKFGDNAYFFNTGARHFVTTVDDVDHTNVYAQGRAYRYFDSRFAPEGVNVDFVQVKEGILHVRTYEKGVEDETLACGTGIVATALAAYMMGITPESVENGVVRYTVQARISRLSVEFEPEKKPNGNLTFKNVYLTGPATFVGEINV
jgi:hypothetical protein